jgi:hypothetical protein
VAYDAATETVMILLLSGFVIGVPVALIHGLSTATPEERHVMELSPSGEGIFWLEANTDASVPGLLRLMREALDRSEAEPGRGGVDEASARIIGRMVAPPDLEERPIGPRITRSYEQFVRDAQATSQRLRRFREAQTQAEAHRTFRQYEESHLGFSVVRRLLQLLKRKSPGAAAPGLSSFGVSW